jgi:hypothetical protein
MADLCSYGCNRLLKSTMNLQTVPPIEAMSAAISFKVSLRARSTTRPPSFAMALATTAPIPRDAPVNQNKLAADHLGCSSFREVNNYQGKSFRSFLLCIEDPD